MSLINDPDSLSQGASTAVSDAVWGTPTGAVVAVTSAGAGLPSITAGDYLVVREHSDTTNNGLYKESGGSPSTSAITLTKVSGANPIAATVEAVTTLGTTADKLNIFWDVAARLAYLIEQNGLGADGVLGQTVYSRAMIDWKDDAYLVGNAPFPMLCIDADAGKYLIGQDAQGNSNGWNWADVSSPAIRTRKLLRSMGWAEVNSDGRETAVYSGFATLGGFEDETGDTAYFMFGSDTEVDNTTDFDFAGPVNEAVVARQDLATDAINGGSGIAISADGRTLTRSDGGNWRTDGFLVGGRIEFRDAENAESDGSPFLMSSVGTGADGAIVLGTGADTSTGFDFVDGGGSNDSIDRNDGGSWLDEGYFVGGNVVVANASTGANDGTYEILGVTAGTIEVATASFTANTSDQTATFGPIDPTGTPDTTVNATFDNLNAVVLKLRVRDGDAKGKTFDESALARAGETVLSNRLFKFPLANVADQKIDETDANIDANLPYTGMSLTVHSSAQSLGSELVGGPYNFGFTIVCNGGTKQEVHEWAQRQIRKTTDIDSDAGALIGRALGGLTRFDGDAFTAGLDQVGAGVVPTNPQGGGSGVYLSGLSALSRNTTTMLDNLGTVRSYPVGTPVTLDFNQTLIDDSAAKYTLFFDRTIRNTISDLVITAVSGITGTFDSAGAGLPASLDQGVGAFVRVSGLTGADAAMNGAYQVTALTSTSQWDVTRYDGETVVTTSSASVYIDENAVDSPDKIIVKDDVPADVTGLASADVDFTFDYTGNVQGGRSGGTDAYVVCRAIGQQTAQFTASTVQQIESAVAKTIPVSSQIERNFLNP